MQTTSSQIQTWVTKSISYDDNYYATSAFYEYMFRWWWWRGWTMLNWAMLLRIASRGNFLLNLESFFFPKRLSSLIISFPLETRASTENGRMLNLCRQNWHVCSWIFAGTGKEELAQWVRRTIWCCGALTPYLRGYTQVLSLLYSCYLFIFKQFFVLYCMYIKVGLEDGVECGWQGRDKAWLKESDFLCFCFFSSLFFLCTLSFFSFSLVFPLFSLSLTLFP